MRSNIPWQFLNIGGLPVFYENPTSVPGIFYGRSLFTHAILVHRKGAQTFINKFSMPQSLHVDWTYLTCMKEYFVLDKYQKFTQNYDLDSNIEWFKPKGQDSIAPKKLIERCFREQVLMRCVSQIGTISKIFCLKTKFRPWLLPAVKSASDGFFATQSRQVSLHTGYFVRLSFTVLALVNILRCRPGSYLEWFRVFIYCLSIDKEEKW